MNRCHDFLASEKLQYKPEAPASVPVAAKGTLAGASGLYLGRCISGFVFAHEKSDTVEIQHVSLDLFNFL